MNALLASADFRSSTTSPRPRFSAGTLEFLARAGKQKNPQWLERNRAEYERLLLEPLQNLARELKARLGALAPDYRFPQKGIGRLKRSADRAKERGGLHFKNWMTYSAARPRVSRFDHNPNLFFMINTEDEHDPVLVAGGLYMPSSRQLRAIRELIARDASAFDRLFASKEFARRFPGGFSTEKCSKRPPRGFDPAHPRLDWLKLQAYFVWRPYTRREFASAGFAKLVADDFRQVLRLNRLLENALERRELPAEPQARRSSALLDRLEGIEHRRREMDF